ncbi:hypothetical protein KXV85_006122, partial [Aspergillus fumigatus]
PKDELAIRWDDPAIGIDWQVETPSLSAKDAAAPLLSEVTGLPVYGQRAGRRGAGAAAGAGVKGSCVSTGISGSVETESSETTASVVGSAGAASFAAMSFAWSDEGGCGVGGEMQIPCRRSNSSRARPA